MVKYLFLILVLCSLTACDYLPKKADKIPDEVKIIVPQECPIPELPAKPKLPIFDLKESDIKDPGKVAKSYVLSIKLLQKYSEQLETLLNSYKHDKK